MMVGQGKMPKGLASGREVGRWELRQFGGSEDDDRTSQEGLVSSGSLRVRCVALEP